MNEERSLPNSADSERAILGSILLCNALIHEARSLLLPEQFWVPSHRRIFQAMLALAEKQSEIAPALIVEELKKDNAAEMVGGQSFITNLTYGLPSMSSVKHYAKAVRDKATLRQLIKTCGKIAAEAEDRDAEPEAILAAAEDALYRLMLEAQIEGRSTARTYQQVSVAVEDLFERWANGDVVSIPTQIPELDRRLTYGGLSSQDLIVIGARTSHGKTALALQIAVNAARAGTPVLFFSLEMASEKLFIRNLSSVTGVPHKQISPWTFSSRSQAAAKIFNGIPKLSSLSITVEDSVTDLSRMLALARDWKRRRPGMALIVTDYMQLVAHKLDRRSRQEEVAQISLGMKRLAKELNVPVIGVSQFNRKPASEDRRPELSDLRESGQVEQDSDLVLFPWGHEAVTETPVRSLKLYCPKQRSGIAGWEIPIDFDADHQWFYTEEMYLQGRSA